MEAKPLFMVCVFILVGRYPFSFSFTQPSVGILIHGIRTDYINKVISELVKTKPNWITLENLNIKEMMRNRLNSVG